MCVRSVDIDLICPSPIFYFHVPGNPIIGVVPIISPPPITRYGSFSSEPLIGWLDDLICRLSRHFSLISPLFFLFLPLSLSLFFAPSPPSLYALLSGCTALRFSRSVRSIVLSPPSPFPFSFFALASTLSTLTSSEIYTLRPRIING